MSFLLRLIFCISLLLSLGTSAQSWTELSEVGSVSHKVKVFYESNEKRLKVEYRRGVFGRTYTKEFEISNTVLIDEVSKEIENLLSDQGYPNKSVLLTVDEILNLKYLDGSSCNVVSFDTSAPDAVNALTPILSKVTNELSKSKASLDSHLLFTLELDDIKSVELRAVTNSENEILEFSLFSEKDDLSSLKVEKDYPFFHVKNGTQHLLTLVVDKDNKEHISILKKNNGPIQNADRIYLKIQSTKKGLFTTSYSNNNEKKLSDSSKIDLRTKTVEYQGVTQIDDTDRFYKALTASDREEFLGSLPFDDDSFINEIFINCMDEKRILVSSRGGALDSSRKDCIYQVLVEGYRKVIEDSHLSRKSENQVLNEYKKCLVEKDILKNHGDISLFINELHKKKDEISICHKELGKELRKQELSEYILSSDEVSSVLSSERARNNISIHILEFYERCVSENDEELCLKLSKEEVSREVFIFKGSSLKNNEGVSKYSKCKMTDLECFQNIYSELLALGQSDYVQESVTSFLPDKDVVLSEDQIEQFTERVQNCFDSQSVNNVDTIEWYSTFKDTELSCQLRAMKKLLPSLVVDSVFDSEPFSLYPLERQDRFKSRSERSFKKKIRDRNVLSNLENDIDELKRDLLPVVVDDYISKRFDDEQVSDPIKSQIKKEFILTMNGKESASIRENISNVFTDQENKGRNFDRSIFIKDRLRDFEIHLSRESKSRDQHIIFENCMKKYSATNSEHQLSSFFKQCENESLREMFFLSSKKEFSNIISSYFPLTSNEGNQLFSVVNEYEECSKNFSNDSSMLSNELSTCFDLHKLKLYKALSELHVQKSRSLFSKSKQAKLEELSTECYESFPFHLVRESRNSVGVELEIDQVDSFYEAKDEELTKLIRTLNSSDSFNSDYIGNYIKKCEQYLEDALYREISSFALTHVKESIGGDIEVDPNILRRLFDEELIREIVKLQKRSGSSGEHFSQNPLKAPITTQSSLNTLMNLIKLMSTHVGKGFVFDKDLMNTELIVFRSELKRALKWINAQERDVSIDELKDFFIDSKLADVLAYSVVSEQVSERFSEFIHKQEYLQKRKLMKKFKAYDFSKFSNDQKVEWNRMLSKYKTMKSVSKKMTSSYDFRRMFREGSESSRLKMDKIKVDYLLPLVTTGKTSKASEDEVIGVIADLILKDNANGGFAEEFTSASATEFLKNDKDNHWAITKWLFYDDGDFDWKSIKSTKSGGKAIDYYAKYILLPKVLKQRVSNFSKNYRANHFKKLLADAQSENDD